MACSPSWDEIADKPWLRQRARHRGARAPQRRSLERRLKNARVGAFKPIADFDWSWPKKIDREALDDLFALGFIADRPSTPSSSAPTASARP